MSVVFDIGNVLLSYEPARLLRQLGLSAAQQQQALSWIVHSEEWLALDRGDIDLVQAVQGGLARGSGLTSAEIRQIYEGVATTLTPLAPMVNLVEQLAAVQVPLYVLSNMPVHTWQKIEPVNTFFKLFNGLVLSYQENLIKPEPAIYELVCQRFGLVPARTIFIDDSLANVQAARALGWHGIHMADASQAAGYAAEVRQLLNALDDGAGT